jgi:glucosyl-3-phosphoglycerate synthase
LRLTLDASVSVVIPALNEEEHIAEVVAFARSHRLTAEVIVIDNSSLDATAACARAAGARVVTGSALGKGSSMQDGVREAAQDIVVFLDGDLSGLAPGLIDRLCHPLLADQADFVKARFGRSAGRVTELTAKPMLKVFFPELAHVAQPLGGIVAARRSLLRQMRFEPDYGVDIGLLIDAQRSGARVTQVDIGTLQHDSQSLQDLGTMANEIARVIYARAHAAGRLHGEQVVAMYEAQRQAAAALPYILSRRRGQLRVLLLSLDTLLDGTDFMQAMGQATGQSPTVDRARGSGDEAGRIKQWAGLMRFVHREQIERVAHSLPIRTGVVAFVNHMRRCGFMVGVLSDDWLVVAEAMRRRVFADFALGHALVVEGEVCTGEVRFSPMYQAPGADDHPDAATTGSRLVCKSHVLQHLQTNPDASPVMAGWAVGSTLRDVPLLQLATPAFAVAAPAAVVAAAPGVRHVGSFEALLTNVPASSAPPDGPANAARSA